MRIWLNKHFGFSKREFNGLLVLIVLIIVLKLVPLVYVYFKPEVQEDPDLSSARQKITVSSLNDPIYVKEHIKNNGSTWHRLFRFDPNTIDLAGWQLLGLSEKQAQSIINYRSKGGTFYQPEDLQKMYTISPEIYKKLLPYIQIEHQESAYPKKNFKYEQKAYVKKTLAVIDINLADSAQLDEVKGIGGAFANRILKYRERLGGFYKKEQLMEVYGLDSVKYEEIKDQISVSPVKLKTININTAVFNDLKTNPYLSYKQINAIIQYRKQHGNYLNPADLKKVVILNQQIIDKITPYISF